MGNGGNGLSDPAKTPALPDIEAAAALAVLLITAAECTAPTVTGLAEPPGVVLLAAAECTASIVVELVGVDGAGTAALASPLFDGARRPKEFRLNILFTVSGAR